MCVSFVWPHEEGTSLVLFITEFPSTQDSLTERHIWWMNDFPRHLGQQSGAVSWHFSDVIVQMKTNVREINWIRQCYFRNSLNVYPLWNSLNLLICSVPHKGKELMWEDIFLPLLLPWIFLYGVDFAYQNQVIRALCKPTSGKKQKGEKELDVKLWWQCCLSPVGSDNVRDTWEGETPAGGMTQKLVGDCFWTMSHNAILLS